MHSWRGNRSERKMLPHANHGRRDGRSQSTTLTPLGQRNDDNLREAKRSELSDNDGAGAATRTHKKQVEAERTHIDTTHPQFWTRLGAPMAKFCQRSRAKQTQSTTLTPLGRTNDDGAGATTRTYKKQGDAERTRIDTTRAQFWTRLGAPMAKFCQRGRARHNQPTTRTPHGQTNDNGAATTQTETRWTTLVDQRTREEAR